MVLLVFLAVMMTVCIVSAGEKDLADSAQKLSGGTWVENSRGLRYRRANGKFVKNMWIQADGKVYRIGSDKYAETGWFTCGGRKYYADSTGSVYYERWLTLKQKKYYFSASGVCVTKKWQKIGQKYYYFNKNGKLLTNCFVGDYYVDGSGARLTSAWVQSGGRRYYLDGSGKRLKNMWIRKDGKFYYMLSDGSMAVDCQIGNYYVDENGVRQEEHVDIPEFFHGRYIFVGDSRMVGMSARVSRTDTAFIAEVGSGYSWLRSTAALSLDRLIKMSPDAKVILAHGINDLANISSYILFYQNLTAKYPATDFYMLSVNPVDYEKALQSGYSQVTNEKIMSFNEALQEAFGSRYLDTYTYLEKKGFETNDGIHYQAATYQKLFNYILKKTG